MNRLSLRCTERQWSFINLKHVIVKLVSCGKTCYQKSYTRTSHGFVKQYTYIVSTSVSCSRMRCTLHCLPALIFCNTTQVEKRNYCGGFQHLLLTSGSRPHLRVEFLTPVKITQTLTLFWSLKTCECGSEHSTWSPGTGTYFGLARFSRIIIIRRRKMGTACANDNIGGPNDI